MSIDYDPEFEHQAMLKELRREEPFLFHCQACLVQTDRLAMRNGMYVCGRCFSAKDEPHRSRTQTWKKT